MYWRRASIQDGQAPGDATVLKQFFSDNFVIFRRMLKRIAFLESMNFSTCVFYMQIFNFRDGHMTTFRHPSGVTPALSLPKQKPKVVVVIPDCACCCAEWRQPTTSSMATFAIVAANRCVIRLYEPCTTSVCRIWFAYDTAIFLDFVGTKCTWQRVSCYTCEGNIFTSLKFLLLFVLDFGLKQVGWVNSTHSICSKEIILNFFA